jgi:hypothetical protein
MATPSKTLRPWAAAASMNSVRWAVKLYHNAVGTANAAAVNPDSAKLKQFISARTGSQSKWLAFSQTTKIHFLDRRTARWSDQPLMTLFPTKDTQA